MNTNEIDSAQSGKSGSRVSIAAVVVTYNRCALLQKAIECLRQQDLDTYSQHAQLTILVVDNASTDKTEQELQPLVDSGVISYFNTGSNLGGAGGFNYGMRKAIEAGYDYIWVMDDDCMTHYDSLRALLEVDEKLEGNYGYLSSVVHWTDGSICLMNVQRHPLTKNIEDFSPELQPCTLASFVSLFVPAQVVEEVGLPVKDFFIWTDDWDFTRRISRKYPCYVVGTSVVTHASQTNGAGTIATETLDRLDRYRKVYRNDVVLYRQEGIKGYGFLIARAAHHVVQVLLHAKKGKLKKVGIIITGNFSGLCFHPQIEYVSRPAHAPESLKEKE